MPLVLAVSFLVYPLAWGQAPAAPHADVIRATGIGRPPQGRSPAQARLMARRAAEVVALRNLVRKLHEDEVVGDDGTFTATTQGFVRGFHYLPPTEQPDGTVEVVVELPLSPVYLNHVAAADRVAFLEAELARPRAELEALRSLHRQTRDWLAAHAAAMERELAQVRSLLNEPAPSAPAGP